MKKSQELLLKFLHDPRFDFSRVTVTYLNRGAPGNRSTVDGNRIVKLRSGFLEVDSGTGLTLIPYHRILTLTYDGKVQWKRDVEP